MRKLFYLAPLVASAFSLVAQETTPAVFYGDAGSAQTKIENAAYHKTAHRRRTVHRRRHHRRVVRKRSGAHSAAIIGGSAAGGAAIGALAGGGKGAAIGALVGGGGGLVYDRATHKKVVRE